MRRTSCPLPMVLAACVLACRPADESLVDPSAFEMELLAADRAFNEATQRSGSAAWETHFAEDGAFIRAGAGEVRGNEAIGAAMAGLDEPSFALAWEPDRAHGSDDGTLGYTVGTYRSTVTTGADTVISRGRYVTVWRRQSDGSLKVVMDLGNPLDP